MTTTHSEISLTGLERGVLSLGEIPKNSGEHDFLSECEIPPSGARETPAPMQSEKSGPILASNATGDSLPSNVVTVVL